MLYRYLMSSIPATETALSVVHISGVSNDQLTQQGWLMVDGYDDKIAAIQSNKVVVWKINADGTLTNIYEYVFSGATYKFGIKFNEDGTKLYALVSASISTTAYRYRLCLTITGDTIAELAATQTAATSSNFPVPSMGMFELNSGDIFHSYRIFANVSTTFAVNSDTYSLVPPSPSSIAGPTGTTNANKAIRFGTKMLCYVGSSNPYSFRILNRNPSTRAITDVATISSSQLTTNQRGICKIDESHFVLKTVDRIIYFRFNDSDNTITELTSGSNFINTNTTNTAGTNDLCLMNINGINRVVYKDGTSTIAVIKSMDIVGETASPPVVLNLPYVGSGTYARPNIWFHYCATHDIFVYISTCVSTQVNIGTLAQTYKGSQIFS